MLLFQSAETPEDNHMKDLSNVEIGVITDLQKTLKHATPTRLVYIVKLLHGIENDVRVAQTLWSYERYSYRLIYVIICL